MNEDLVIPDFENGLDIYDFLVNHVMELDQANLGVLTERLVELDSNGQFSASSARFLASVDRNRFESAVSRLVEISIGKDRERKYIGSLLKSLWGDDYMEKADSLRKSDDNFRRIYKRIYQSGDF